MTQQDDWRPEMARLAQRQDQLERQQRDSTRNVEALQRDADALKRDVDRRMDSLRRETDRQFRDGERRVSSLERSRDTFENLFWFSMPLVAAVAVIIVLVIAVIVASREQRQEPGEPEQRSPSSIDAPWPVPGVPGHRGLLLPGHLSDNLTAPTASTPPGQPWPTVPGTTFSFNPSTGEERPPIESQSYRVGRVFAICFLTGPADPVWSSRYLPPGSRLHAGRSQGAATRGLAQLRNPTRPRAAFFEGRPPVFRSINQLATVCIGALWTLSVIVSA